VHGIRTGAPVLVHPEEGRPVGNKCRLVLLSKLVH
jgi:hypothetical protein